MKNLESIKNDLYNYFAGQELNDEYYENDAILALAQDGKDKWEDASADTLDEVKACDAIVAQVAEKIYKMWNNKRYFANYNANNGTHMEKAIESDNLEQIVKDIQEIAEGERFSGSTSKWSVYDEAGELVAAGEIRANGERYRGL